MLCLCHFCKGPSNSVVNETKMNKKVTHLGSKAPVYGEFYRDFPQRLCTCIIPRMQKACTILAGGSAASPKAPPYGSL